MVNNQAMRRQKTSLKVNKLVLKVAAKLMRGNAYLRNRFRSTNYHTIGLFNLKKIVIK